mgnify:CR=1 FL=1
MDRKKFAWNTHSRPKKGVVSDMSQMISFWLVLECLGANLGASVAFPLGGPARKKCFFGGFRLHIGYYLAIWWCTERRFLIFHVQTWQHSEHFWKNSPPFWGLRIAHTAHRICMSDKHVLLAYRPCEYECL